MRKQNILLPLEASLGICNCDNMFQEWINLKSLVNIRDRHSAESSSVRQLYGTVLSNEENFVKVSVSSLIKCKSLNFSHFC